MRGKDKDKGDKIFECGGFGVPSDKYIRDRSKSVEYIRQAWFKAHPYRCTKAEVGGKHGR